MADVIRRSKYPRDKTYAEMTREERDRWIRLGIAPKVSIKDKKNIRPKDTLKGTTGTKVKRKEGTEKRAYFGPQGGSNLAKNLRPAPPPRFSRIQLPNAAGDLKDAQAAFAITAKEQKLIQEGKMKQDPKTGKPIYPKKKSKVDSDKILPPAIARIVESRTVKPILTKPPKISIKPTSPKPAQITRVIRAGPPPSKPGALKPVVKPKLDAKTVKKANQLKVKTKLIRPLPKLEAPKAPVLKTKTPTPPKQPKLPRIPKTITIKTGPGKSKTKTLDKTKIKNWAKDNKIKPHENSRKYLTRALQALGYIKSGAKLSGIGTALWLALKPKSVAAADDPAGDVKKAEAAARKRVGTSMDWKHGGKIARYSKGRSIRRGLIKDISDGNSFVQNIYDN